MYLKNYQKKVVESLKQFFEISFNTKQEFEAAKLLSYEDKSINISKVGWILAM